MKKTNNSYELDSIIHAKSRLAIMSLLMSHKEVDFSFAKDKLGLTDGNLGGHIKKLEDVGYVAVRKIFIKNKPKSYISVTKEGIDAYQLYVSQLEAILNLGNKKI
ncbi:MAG TPA: transcriptional regulator [Bacillota bacterium]|nr:transcriptional regulator [Bacillota bacterium]